MTRKKIAYAVIILMFFGFRLPGLGYDISNTDAFRWHLRTDKFLRAVKDFDTRGMYQHYQPGVTLMWLNSLVKQTAFSFQYHILQDKDPHTIKDSGWYPLIHGISKAELVFLYGIMLIVQIYLIKKNFGEKSSLIYGLLLVGEPYLIGIDRWFHLTSLEAYLGFTVLLLYITWYESEQKKYLILSAILTAFAVLSKTDSLVIIPVIILTLVPKFIKKKKRTLFSFALFLAVFIMTMVVIFPPLVLHPVDTISKIYQGAANAVTDSYRDEQLSLMSKTIFYNVVFLYKLSPLVLVIFILSLVQHMDLYRNFFHRFIFIYFLAFYFAFTIAQQKIDRYAVVMIPPIILMTSLYLAKFKNHIALGILGANLLHVFIIAYIYYPVFSAYYSPIFLGTRGAKYFGIYDNSGEYFAQAAFYLNDKPRDTKVYVPNGMSSFEPYFKGTVVWEMDENTDYFVNSYDLLRPEVDNLGCSYMEKSFGSREYDVVFIFRCK